MTVPVGIVLSNNFMEEMLNSKLEFWAANYTFKVGLFKDTSTLTDCASTLADVVAANFTGYTVKDIDPANWSASVNVGGCIWQADNVPITWVPTGIGVPNNIGGYYLYDAGAPVIKWWEWFSTGTQVVGATFAPFTITPKLREKRIV